MNRKILKHKAIHNLNRSRATMFWVLYAVICGLILGVIGAAFYHGFSFVTYARSQYPKIVFLLPVGSVLIVWFYRVFHNAKDGGTNLVLSAIHSDDEIPLRMSLLIFVSTLLSHLFGASVGREGAALQIGGSIGNSLGKLFHLNETDKKTMIMCGMSAAFSALFGTPMAAAIFSMEVVSVGIMHYAALVPCVVSSLVARAVASALGAPSSHFSLGTIPDFTVKNAILISIVAVAAGLLSIIFCILLHKTGDLFCRLFKNTYLKALLGGSILLGLTLLFPSQRYNGAGLDLIRESIEGAGIHWYDFLLKIIFTVVSIAACYKGGEIVPSLVIGSAFGAFFGRLLGLDPGLCAAVGMGTFFCGVTNCPITSLLMCFELFGLAGWPYYLLSVAFGYMVSGYYGLYSSQKIIYSKYKSNYIDKQAH